MFNHRRETKWKKTAEGNFMDEEGVVSVKHFDCIDGVKLSIMRNNDCFKLTCKCATQAMIDKCSELPLFEMMNPECGLIGMSEYTKDKELILKYLHAIDPDTDFSYTLNDSPEPVSRAKLLEEARIKFLATKDQEIESLTARVDELEKSLSELKTQVREQAEMTNTLNDRKLMARSM